MDAVDAQPLCGFNILHIVVNEDRFFRCDVKPFQHNLINTRIRFSYAFLSRRNNEIEEFSNTAPLNKPAAKRPVIGQSNNLSRWPQCVDITYKLVIESLA